MKSLKDPERETFGALLKLYRLRCEAQQHFGRVTQERLGEMVGDSRGDRGLTGATISNWEHGKASPVKDDRPTQIALLKALLDCGGLQTMEEAERLLQAGNYGRLSDAERLRLFPNHLIEEPPDRTQAGPARTKLPVLWPLLSRLLERTKHRDWRALSTRLPGWPSARFTLAIRLIILLSITGIIAWISLSTQRALSTLEVLGIVIAALVGVTAGLSAASDLYQLVREFSRDEEPQKPSPTPLRTTLEPATETPPPSGLPARPTPFIGRANLLADLSEQQSRGVAERVAGVALRLPRAGISSLGRVTAYVVSFGVLLSIASADPARLAAISPTVADFVTSFNALLQSSPWLAAVISKIGGDVFVNIVSRVVLDEHLSDEQLQELLLHALDDTPVSGELARHISDATISALEQFGALRRREYYEVESAKEAKDAGRHSEVMQAISSIAQMLPGWYLGQAIPFHLPPRPTPFIGRADLLAELHEKLLPGSVTFITGPGGVGKTALSLEAVYTLPADRLPDGVLFHSFYGRPRVAECFEYIVRALQPAAPVATPELAAALLRGKRQLLLLDGAEEADDLPLLLAHRGDCALLVTTRLREANPGYYVIDLQPLPEEEAVELLRSYGPHGADEVLLQRLASDLAYLPLALRIAGGYLGRSGVPAGRYADWLREDPIKQLTHGTHRDDSIERLFEHTLAQLPLAATELLALFGLLEQLPVGAAPLAAALQTDEDAVMESGGELVHYHLLRWEGERLWVEHALIHAYARELLSAPADQFNRLVQWYFSYFMEQTQRGAAAFPGLAAEIDHHLRLQANALARGEFRAASDLGWAAQEYLDLSGQPARRESLLQTALVAARALGDRRGEGWHLSHLGLTYHEVGRVLAAVECHRQATVILREIGDRQSEGKSLSNLGNAFTDLGWHEEAIGQYEQALAIAQEIGDRHMEATALGNLGSAYHHLGRYEEAIARYEQALAIAQRIGDRRGEGNHLGNLGLAYADLGRYEEAIAQYEQALAIAREIGDRRGEGTDLNNLGAAYENLQQYSQAIAHYEAALVIFRAILPAGHPDIARTENNLANARAAMAG